MSNVVYHTKKLQKNLKKKQTKQAWSPSYFFGELVGPETYY